MSLWYTCMHTTLSLVSFPSENPITRYILFLHLPWNQTFLFCTRWISPTKTPGKNQCRRCSSVWFLPTLPAQLLLLPAGSASQPGHSQTNPPGLAQAAGSGLGRAPILDAALGRMMPQGSPDQTLPFLGKPPPSCGFHKPPPQLPFLHGQMTPASISPKQGCHKRE